MKESMKFENKRNYKLDKRLKINKETIKELSESKLKEIAGGLPIRPSTSCQFSCLCQ